MKLGHCWTFCKDAAKWNGLGYIVVLQLHNKIKYNFYWLFGLSLSFFLVKKKKKGWKYENVLHFITVL